MEEAGDLDIDDDAPTLEIDYGAKTVEVSTLGGGSEVVDADTTAVMGADHLLVALCMCSLAGSTRRRH